MAAVHRSMLMGTVMGNIDQNFLVRSHIVDANVDYPNVNYPHQNPMLDCHVDIATIEEFHVQCLACEKASVLMVVVVEPAQMGVNEKLLVN